MKRLLIAVGVVLCIMACNGEDSTKAPEPTRMPAPTNTTGPTAAAMPTPDPTPAATSANMPTPTPELLPDARGSSQISEEFAGLPPVTEREVAAFRAYLTGAEIDFTGYEAPEAHTVPGFSEEELTEVCNFYAENDWPVTYKASSSGSEAVQDLLIDNPIRGDVNVVGQRTLADLYLMMTWSLVAAAPAYAPSVVVGAHQEYPGDDIEDQSLFLEAMGGRLQQLMIQVCESEPPAPLATHEQAAVREYFSEYCDADETLLEGITWNEYRAAGQGSLNRANSLIPPAAVREFHLASVAALQDLLDAIADFEGDLPTDPIELLEVRAFADAQIALEAAVDKLDGNTYTIYIAECS